MEPQFLLNFNDLPFSAGNMTLLGEGFSNRLFKSQGGWVLKVAKYAQSFSGLRREKRLLARLQNESFEAPLDYQLIEACEHLPFGGAYYRYLEGQPCTLSSSQNQTRLSTFLLQIHNQDAKDLPHWNIVAWQWSAFESHLTSKNLHTIKLLFDAYPSSDAVERCIHGDIWPENLIQRAGILVGIIDWENSGMADIAMDFAGLAYLPDFRLNKITKAYTEQGGVLGQRFQQRLQVFRFRRELIGLLYAIEHPESGELYDSCSKIEKLLAEMDN